MKRPLFTVGFVYLTAMTVAFYINYVAVMVVLLILAFGVLLIAGDKSSFGKTMLTILMTGILALVVSVGFTVFRHAVVGSFEGESLPMEAMIIGEEHHDRIHNYEIMLDFNGVSMLGGSSVKANLTTFERMDAEIGDTIFAVFKIAPLREITDNEMMYLSKGILTSTTLASEAVTIENPNKRIYSAILKTKASLVKALEEYIGNNRGSLLSALLFGEGENVDNSLRQSFSRSGISHILAISGLHLSIVVHIAMGFISLIVGKRRGSFASIFVIWIFVILGGAGYSLVRSGIMLTIYFVGVLIDRESDGLNSLGLAAIAVTTMNPYSIGNLSMQLSFLSTFGILVLAPIIERGIFKYILNDKLKSSRTIIAIVKIFGISVAAQILVAPIITLKFGFVSLISPITNILIAPIVPLLIMLGLLTAFSGVLGFVLIATIFGDISTLLVELVINISDFLSKVPFASVYVARSYIGIWFFFVGISAVWLYMTKDNGKAKAYLVVAAIFTLLVGANTQKIFDLNTVKILNTEGSRTVAVVKNTRAIIIGVPESRYIATQIIGRLEGYGVSGIDLVVASSSEELMTSGASYLLSTKKIDYIVAPEDEPTTNYLSMTTKAKLLPLRNMEIDMLDGVKGKLIENWGMIIEVNNNKLLKIFEEYDIMKSNDIENTAVIDAGGVPYINKKGIGMQYIAHFGGNGEFIFR